MPNRTPLGALGLRAGTSRPWCYPRPSSVLPLHQLRSAATAPPTMHQMYKVDSQFIAHP
jgi:hypothetical protein